MSLCSNLIWHTFYPKSFTNKTCPDEDLTACDHGEEGSRPRPPFRGRTPSFPLPAIFKGLHTRTLFVENKAFDKDRPFLVLSFIRLRKMLSLKTKPINHRICVIRKIVLSCKSSERKDMIHTKHTRTAMRYITLIALLALGAGCAQRQQSAALQPETCD